MGFFRTIRKSIYDVAFYATVKTESLGVALKYYTLFVLGMAILIAIPLYVLSGLGIVQMKEAGDIRTRVLAMYPDELVLNFQNGKITSNVEEPYSIPVPPEFSRETYKNLVVINTSEPITLSDFDRYDTLAILGSDAIWTRDVEKNKTEIQKFDQFSKESLVINEQKVAEFLDIALRIGKIAITVFLVFLPFIIFACLWVWYLIYLLFGALIIWIVSKLRKADLTYDQSYKSGLYLITLPIIYSAVTTAGPLSMFHIPFGFTLIFVVLAYINFTPKKIIEKSSSAVTASVGITEPITFFTEDATASEAKNAETEPTKPEANPVKSDESDHGAGKPADEEKT